MKAKPFTFDEYRALLQLAQKNYHFVTYNAANASSKENIIFWRHDIDCSVHRALKLAYIEAEEGITATYFVWLHSFFYHFFERETVDKLQEIISLGHSIGLHFDCHYHRDLTAQTLPQKILQEAEILETVLPTKISVFSFHDTTKEILQMDWDVEYQGRWFVNTYSKWFRDNTFYVSDSNGIWRYISLWDVLEKQNHSRVQVLTHPVWWTDEVYSPKQKIMQVIDNRACETKERYLRLAPMVIETVPDCVQIVFDEDVE